MTEATVLITTGVGADQTFLDGANAAKNYGASILYNFITTQRNAILRFDLSGIPAGATCTSAVLKLYHYNASGANFSYNLFKITDANGNWIEGTKTGATAGAGEPCWNAKAANGSGGVTTAWAGSAGLSTAGTDYVNTVLATAADDSSVSTNDVLEFTFNAAGLLVLADWFGDATNNGFVIWHSNAGAVASAFHSKESTTSGYRPVLVVNYETVVLDALTATDFTLSPITFDAPVLEDVLLPDNLTAKDFTLAPVTFDAPTLTSQVLTPDCRVFTIEAENREYVIPSESREYTIEPEMRGLKIDKDSEYKYLVGNVYDALTGKDLTLARPTFDTPSAGMFGYYNLDDGLSAWNTAKVEETYPMVWITGDSIVHGDYVDAGTGWAQMLEAAIHTAYGTGGKYYTAIDGATYWTSVGDGWTSGNNYYIQPPIHADLYGYGHNADNTNPLVFKATGKIFEVIYFVRTGQGKAFTIQLDSETPENADTTGTWNIKKHTLTAASAGEHTITITPASSEGNIYYGVRISGITVKNGTGGAIVYNASYGGMALESASGANTLAVPKGIPVWGAHLHIAAIGINDYKGATQATLENFALWLTKLREDKTASQSMLYIAQTPYTKPGEVLTQAQYNALYKADADLCGGAYINIHRLMGTTPAVAYAAGYFDSLNDVHPNEIGHDFIYDRVLPYVTG